MFGTIYFGFLQGSNLKSRLFPIDVNDIPQTVKASKCGNENIKGLHKLKKAHGG